METGNVVEILDIDYKKRRNKIFLLIIAAIVLFAVSTLMFLKFNSNKDNYLSYNEKSNLDYKVYLKDNDFFEKDYLDKDKQYIASLIDYIDADFSYSIQEFDNSKKFQYSYGIDATINVEDKNEKRTIYTSSKELLPEQVLETDKDIIINENIKINYNEYNNLISKFVNVYDLNDTISSLNIDMYVRIGDNLEELNHQTKKKVVSLSIPLTTKTVGIDLNYSLIDSAKENAVFIKTSNGKIFYLTVSLITFICCIGICVYTSMYYLNTRTDETIYNSKLRRILYNYKSYIQKAEISELNFEGYQTVYIDSFNDLLEIRDTLQEPILMTENKEKTDSHFIIPSKTGILYIYLLGINSQQKRLAQNNKVNEEVTSSNDNNNY